MSHAPALMMLQIPGYEGQNLMLLFYLLDWGEMTEGHRGALDRLDSVVFAAPVFFHVVRYAFQ